MEHAVAVGHLEGLATPPAVPQIRQRPASPRPRVRQANRPTPCARGGSGGDTPAWSTTAGWLWTTRVSAGQRLPPRNRTGVPAPGRHAGRGRSPRAPLTACRSPRSSPNGCPWSVVHSAERVPQTPPVGLRELHQRGRPRSPPRCARPVHGRARTAGRAGLRRQPSRSPGRSSLPATIAKRSSAHASMRRGPIPGTAASCARDDGRAAATRRRARSGRTT